MEKKPFLTLQQVQEITKTYPTPFHIYDEKAIRENARKVKKAFAWNPGYKEYFAVKATPNPRLIQILHEEGFGCDCSSLPELQLSDVCGVKEHDIMFSSNVTPAEDYKLASDLNTIINFDDITHLDFYDKVVGDWKETMSCRFNPGGDFVLNNSIMDTPQEAKYGMTREQLVEAFKYMKQKGVKHFGIHAFLASNTVANAYYPALARILFQLAVDVQKETGVHIAFINLSGGVGIPYRPSQEPNDIMAIGEGVHQAYDEVLVPAGMDDVAIHTEMGRFIFWPYGALVAQCIHQKHTYKEYAGLTPARRTSCARRCTAHTTISPCSARKTRCAIIRRDRRFSAKITTSLPLTAICRRLTSATCFISTIPARTASRWAITITQSCVPQSCCFARTARDDPPRRDPEGLLCNVRFYRTV